MHINLIILGAFLAVLVFIGFFYRRALLSRLPALPGEMTLSEEDGVAVYETGGPRVRYYNKCRVRLTDSRLIIAQKMLFMRESFALRFVVSYRAGEAKPDILSILKKGYYDIEVPASRISVAEKGGGASVSLPIATFGGRRVEFEIKRAGEFLRAFAQKG